MLAQEAGWVLAGVGQRLLSSCAQRNEGGGGKEGEEEEDAEAR